MIRMRPWRPGDQDAFVPRADFAAERAAVDWDWADGAPGPTWTLHLWDGRVLGMGGGVAGADGSWLVWAQLAPFARQDTPQLLWLAMRVVEELFRRGARRIEAQCRPSAAAIRCLKRLGFSLFDAAEWPGVGLILCLERSAPWTL